MRFKELVLLYIGRLDHIIEVQYRNDVHRLTVDAWLEAGSTPLTNKKVIAVWVRDNELHVAVG